MTKSCKRLDDIRFDWEEQSIKKFHTQCKNENNKLKTGHESPQGQYRTIYVCRDPTFLQCQSKNKGCSVDEIYITIQGNSTNKTVLFISKIRCCL